MLSNLQRAISVYSAPPIIEPAVIKSQSLGRPSLVLPQVGAPSTMAERWASYVIRACKAEADPATLALWAHEVAVSYTTLCESCRLIDVQPRLARDFARVLRLIVKPPGTAKMVDVRDLATFLDIRDRRTLNSIMQKAGLQQSAGVPSGVSVITYLDRQRFIERENPGLRIIRDLMVTALTL